MKRVIVSLCLCSMLLFCLTGCGEQEPKDIRNKLNAELEYVEDLIFKIANKYAKEEYLEENEINWQWIKDDVNRMNNLWGSLVLDLTKMNIQNQDIMEFSGYLNKLLISMAEEEEQAMLEQLNVMYQKVIVYKEHYMENKNAVEKNKIKSGVLNAYCFANRKDWTKAQTEMDRVIESYKGLMNNISYAEENGYQLNKIYVLLEEYRVSLQTENEDLVRMKYITAVESL